MRQFSGWQILTLLLGAAEATVSLSLVAFLGGGLLGLHVSPWLAACAALPAFGLSQGPAAADQLQEILDRGRIAGGVPQGFAPFGSVGADLQPEGYDVDVVALVAENLGVELEIVPVSSANRIPYLQIGEPLPPLPTLSALHSRHPEAAGRRISIRWSSIRPEILRSRSG